MMKARQAAWWQIYLLLILFGALLFWEYSDPLPRVPAQAIDLVLLAVFGGLVAWWLYLNRSGLGGSAVDEEGLRRSMTVKIYENGRPANTAAKLCEPGFFYPADLGARRRVPEQAGLGVDDPAHRN